MPYYHLVAYAAVGDAGESNTRQPRPPGLVATQSRGGETQAADDAGAVTGLGEVNGAHLRAATETATP